MAKKIAAAIVIVAIIMITLLLICPAIFVDIPFLPQEVRDQVLEESDTDISDVEIEWSDKAG